LFCQFAITLLVLSWTLRSEAAQQVNVNVDSTGFSPTNVNIVLGMAVQWTAQDQNGYTITSTNGSWSPKFLQNKNDSAVVTFSSPSFQAGTYGYTDGHVGGHTGVIFVTTNIPPSLTITNPVNGAFIATGTSFNFGVTASDTDADGLSDVAFYNGANLLQDINPPNPLVVPMNLSIGGVYTLTAIATDYAGAHVTNSVTISVGIPKPALGIGTYSNQPAVFFPVVGTNFTLQMATNLSSPTWVTVSNAIPITGVIITNPPPNVFFRLN
jgi:plastocyanin